MTTYRLHDADDRLLYLGITVDFAARIKQHSTDKPWWGDVVRMSLERHPDRATALAAEQVAIRTERPRHNTQHNGQPPANRPWWAMKDYVTADDLVRVYDHTDVGRHLGNAGWHTLISHEVRDVVAGCGTYLGLGLVETLTLIRDLAIATNWADTCGQNAVQACRDDAAPYRTERAGNLLTCHYRCRCGRAWAKTYPLHANYCGNVDLTPDQLEILRIEGWRP